MYNVLDLFSGIGGFSLGLQRTGGFRTIAFCEIDNWAARVLNKHWPEVPVYGDIKKLHGKDVWPVDVICGGFPCQDISTAGKMRGIDGDRSGLWKEYARLIGELEPRYAIVENVSALLVRGFERVLGDLATLGYSAEWHCIPAGSLGAPHRRDRVWLLAYPDGARRWDGSGIINGCNLGEVSHDSGSSGGTGPFTRRFEPSSDDLRNISQRWWEVEPELDRVAYGISDRVDRNRGLGNAIVPQIATLIGMEILRYERNKPTGNGQSRRTSRATAAETNERTNTGNSEDPRSSVPRFNWFA